MQDETVEQFTDKAKVFKDRRTESLQKIENSAHEALLRSLIQFQLSRSSPLEIETAFLKLLQLVADLLDTEEIKSNPSLENSLRIAYLPKSGTKTIHQK